MEYTSKTPDETKAIAAEFTKTLQGGEFVALKGDLGAGKTTFVQGMADMFGIEEPVRSPTYNLLKSYQTKNASIKYLVHVDLYRLEGEIDLEEIGLEEWLNREDAVVIVEWAEKMNMDKDRVVSIVIVDEDSRKIEIK